MPRRAMAEVDVDAADLTPPSGAAGERAAVGERPERRHLTVMFCDLARSTSLSHELDPEDYRLVLRSYQRTCAAVFSRYGGFVSKYEGDGIRALFGFPAAHEDNAERAVRAGLEIAAAVPAIRLPQGAARLADSLSVRVSIATSTVVVGETIGAGVSKEMPVWGEAPNLAARLKARSRPNTVVACEATKELLGKTFELEELGSRPIEGYREPVPAWRVVSALEARNRFEALGRGAARRFIGRRRELAFLQRRWDEASAGAGNAVLVAGEPGIGKSRLLEEFTKRLEPKGCFVLRYQCSPFHTQSALYPLVSHLARIAGDALDDSPEGKLDRLEQWLEFRPEESREEVMPLFAELLSIPVPEGRYRDARLSPEERRRRTMAALEQQLAWLAESLPLLVLFEDVHWADPSTLELLERCTARISDVRALLVVTHRPERHRDLADAGHLRRLALEPLSPAQSRELVASLSAGGNALQREIVDELVAKADGVPLYLEELTTAVLDAAPARAAGARREPSSGDIPASLQDSLHARLDQLGTAKEAAELGAVIGRDFSVELLLASSARSREELEGSLARLVELGLVVQRGSGRYRFRHALIREAAYGCLLKSRREEHHGVVARALEARFPDTVAQHPELLAHHYREAGEIARSVDYAHLAAKQALSRSANAEAVEHIGDALAILDSAPRTDAAGMAEPARSERRLELLIALGTARRAVDGFASSRTMDAFRSALSLCKRGVGGAQELAGALRGLYTCYYVRGEHRVSRAIGAEVLEQAKRAGEPARLISGHYMLGASMFWQGEFVAARREFEDALHRYRKVVPQDRELSEQVDLKVTLMNHLAWTLWMLGYPDRAMRTITRSLEAAHDLPQPFTQAMALFVHGAIHSSCHGGHADAARLASLRDLCDAYGLAFPAACARVLEGQALIAQGDIRRGIARILSGMSAFDEQEAGLGKPWGLASAAAGHLRLGQTGAGLELVERGLELVEASGEYQWHADLLRVEGELLVSAQGGRSSRGEASLRRAADVAASQEARSLELRARTSLARVLAARGRVLEARKQLAGVVSWFDEGASTHDLQEALRVLRELEAAGDTAARARPVSRAEPSGACAAPPPARALPDVLERWRRRGRLLSVAGHRVFVLEAGDANAEPLVLLHGFPTSSFDFHRVVDRLAERHRVIVHDHIGLGLSEKPSSYSYSLLEQADVALSVWRALGVSHAHVLAHDYGASIATELVARRQRDYLPITLTSLTLCNASLYPELARLRLTQRLLKHRAAGPLLARLAGKRFFAARLAALWGLGPGPHTEDVDALWSALEAGGGRGVLAKLASYPDERRRFRERWLAPLSSLDLPVSLLWGRRDPVAVAAIAERLCDEIPHARLTWLDDCGHVPMLEEPARFAEEALVGIAAMRA